MSRGTTIGPETTVSLGTTVNWKRTVNWMNAACRKIPIGQGNTVDQRSMANQSNMVNQRSMVNRKITSGEVGIHGNWCHTQAGNSTLAVILIAVLVAIALLIASVVFGYVQALHRVRAASDMAALTAATQASQLRDDDEACAGAARAAEDNGAQMSSCEIVRAGVEVAASVEVLIPLQWSFPGLPESVSSTSYAGNS